MGKNQYSVTGWGRGKRQQDFDCKSWAELGSQDRFEFEKMAGQSEARSPVISENVKLKLRKRLELEKLIRGSVCEKVQVKIMRVNENLEETVGKRSER